MTTLTIDISDAKAAELSQLIKSKGGVIIADSSELSKEEQVSLNQSLKEARLIREGKLKPLSFDELWDE
ncbi:hypothetical protein [Mucilaginibacter psychrotolerans]|uniref:Uncharacterized protein n=1 Tax=Mucilaginibacter psychrotolerans TaxID=1524096 RepID=A0A4Y8S3Z8_9SPHI|nr:hypothetical protein [Mucilaginibacter psychrotolerans]TFF33411.1 hypothetical protein E2R66_26120 [Mucilaginibacter psychrotolerans]